MATTTRTRTAAADTAPKGLPRDLDESDVIADGQRMADELAAREAKAAPAPRRRSTKAAAQDAAAQPAQQPAAAPKAAKGKGKAAPAQPQPQQPAQPADAKPAPTPRLNQDEMVLAYLAAHPNEEFSPYAISRAITPEGRKPLGVRDCCARLAAADKIAQTSDKPRRYRLAAAPKPAARRTRKAAAAN
ncbi:hypothetical protein GCE86_06725 [Micromonospora terminaliae]|uniref:Uncharacterized protein n=1 Tax=Micromonospora terminaliae TaxID=1914461 RepID=A0AAJ2ZHB5_9ACTN|nr:hypothetical protein [Micromonospora terminaliae]NES30057.1 hypothetical protein [Micromonospora terminaliae]QGL46770.1 hypothetical protein GCE86_06725 [Micromonospora terminaliae]